MHTWIFPERSKKIIAAFSLIAVSLVILSNKNGPAKNGNLVTGASFNNFNTCSKCHKGGNFGGDITLQLLDSATNVPVTSYKPGGKYKLKIDLTKTSTATTKYGFQTVCVNSANANVNRWSTLPANVHSILKSGRTYVEHSVPLTSGTIILPWRGPAKGTGTVKFFTGGNIVNGNSLTSGDQPVHDSLFVPESPSPAAFAENSNEAANVKAHYSLAPFTHAGERGVLFSNGGAQQKAQIIFTDMQGNILYTNSTIMNQGDNLVPVPNNGKVKGLVNITVITQDGVKTSLKLGLNQ